MKSLINRKVHVRFANPAGVLLFGQKEAVLVDSVDGVLVDIEDGFAKIETHTVHVRRDYNGRVYTEAEKHRAMLAHPQKYIASIMTADHSG